MRNFLCIVGPGDLPLYEAQITRSNNQANNQKPDLVEFLIHASLDSIEYRLINQPTNQSTLVLRNIDRLMDQSISCLITISQIKLIFIHDPKIEDLLLNRFLFECYELFIKQSLNPFYQSNQVIQSIKFDERIKQIGEKYLR